MMRRWTRREFLALAGGGTVAAALGGFRLTPAFGQAGGRVVVIGGGFGGAACAKYLRRANPAIEVTLVERNAQYITCPSSNLVIAGLRKLSELTVSYDRLQRNHGIRIVHGNAIGIDAYRREVMLEDGKVLPFDRAVVAPGIDSDYEALGGYSEEVAELMPHAWSAGPQTELLRRQLEAMDDGQTVIITVPLRPFRCPPGPYERASLIAYYLKRTKPKSKILILDANDDFPAQEIFQQAWQALYPGMIEWIPGSRGGTPVSVDAKTMTVMTHIENYKGAVINVIPAERAGFVARRAELINGTGWCPVDPRTFESTQKAGIHVIGDAAIADRLPKSAAAANTEAKACAMAVAALLADGQVGEPSFINACYALVAPDYGISIAGVFQVTDQEIVPVQGAVGNSPVKASQKYRKKEAQDAEGWYKSIVQDTFA